MHELQIAITVVGLLLACWVVVHYGVLLVRDLFFEVADDEHQDLDDAEGEALEPGPYTTGRLRLVDLTGPDADGITPRGCWASVWRGDDFRDCGLDTVDHRGVCRVHAEVLESIEGAGA